MFEGHVGNGMLQSVIICRLLSQQCAYTCLTFTAMILSCTDHFNTLHYFSSHT